MTLCGRSIIFLVTVRRAFRLITVSHRSVGTIPIVRVDNRRFAVAYKRMHLQACVLAAGRPIAAAERNRVSTPSAGVATLVRAPLPSR